VKWYHWNHHSRDEGTRVGELNNSSEVMQLDGRQTLEVINTSQETSVPMTKEREEKEISFFQSAP
jgi:hypothetical protein